MRGTSVVRSLAGPFNKGLTADDWEKGGKERERERERGRERGREGRFEVVFRNM
jgi:hypothetical protein